MGNTLQPSLILFEILRTFKINIESRSCSLLLYQDLFDPLNKLRDFLRPSSFLLFNSLFRVGEGGARIRIIKLFNLFGDYLSPINIQTTYYIVVLKSNKINLLRLKVDIFLISFLLDSQTRLFRNEIIEAKFTGDLDMMFIAIETVLGYYNDYYGDR